jgi:hypothetical protein
MKIATICVACALGLASAGAAAQGASDAMEKLRACSLLANAERLECLEKLSRDIAPPPRSAASVAPAVAPAADNWIIIETTSLRRPAVGRTVPLCSSRSSAAAAVRTW